MFNKIMNTVGFLTKKTENENRRSFAVILIFSAAALFASFMLTIDEFYLLQHPNETLNCSINLVLNCSTVMQTWQAAIFGFPNMVLGLIAYTSLLTIAVIALLGIKLPKIFMVAVNFGAFVGIVFSEWLTYQSIYVIEVLCPYCLIVLFSTLLIFAAITHYNLRNNSFEFRLTINNKIQSFLDKEYDKVLVAVWIAALIGLIISHFGSSLFA